MRGGDDTRWLLQCSENEVREKVASRDVRFLFLLFSNFRPKFHN